MAAIEQSVDDLLKKMKSSSQTGKGTVGEEAVFKICEEFYQKQGGILVHSYEYETDDTLAGNIKRNDNNLYVEKLGPSTEIDVLYVSKYRVFPIEVKAYRAKEIRLDDRGIYGCYKTDKSPIHQNEMHCRHLYSHIFRALPDGKTDYIVPLVCLMDRANIIDERSDWQKVYIKQCILDNLHEFISRYNTPLDYAINLEVMNSVLKEVMISNSKYLPPRY